MTLFQRINLVVSLLVSPSLIAYGLTNLTRNDPFPLFSSRDPYNFLTNHAKRNILSGSDYPQERFSFAVSVFRQGADKSRNQDKERVELFDINGNWNMLALTYDPTVALISPTIASFVNTTPPRNDLIPPFDETQVTEITSMCIPLLIDPANTDTAHNLGFFSVPGTYRKNGIRFDGQMALCNDLGLTLDISFADIKSYPCDFLMNCPETVTCVTLNDDSTGTETCTIFGIDCTCFQYLDLELMKKLRKIAAELHLDIHEYQKTSVEDFRLGAYWRHIFASDCDVETGQTSWSDVPCCLFIPFITVEGSIPFEEPIDNRKLFAIPFGNNGHGAVGVTTGFNIVYNTWVEFGSEVGFSHFFSQFYGDLPMPTEELQVGLIPFSVDACIQPGNNWHFAATLTTPYFLPHLSFYAQYFYVNHNKDHVTILKDLRPADVLESPNKREFLVCKYERESKWDSQMANVAFNYEFCPEITAGIAWQLPLRGRNVFRSTTILFSLIGVF